MKQIFVIFVLAFAVNSYAGKGRRNEPPAGYKSDGDCRQYELEAPNGEGEQRLMKNGKYVGFVLTPYGAYGSSVAKVTAVESCYHPTDESRHRIRGHKNYRK
jgi:hypothetical protein